MFHVEQGRGEEDVAERCSLLTPKENQKSVALCEATFCLPSACKNAPLGQRQGGVFRLPPSLPLDSTHPATGQGLHALDNPKEEVEAQKS